VIGPKTSARATACSIAPVVLAVVLWGAPSAAQTPGRVEIGGGARWVGSLSFGQVAASETMFGGGTRELFQSSTDLDHSTGVEVRVSTRVAALVHVEGAVALNRTNLTTRVSGDVEGAPDATASEPVTQYGFEAGATLQFARASRRLTPFASGGAAYLRQLHEGRTLLETGHAFYVGGGVKYLFTAGGTGRLKATGLRADVRAVFMSTAIAPDDNIRTAPSVSGSFFVRF
jgi:Outer membrane protein beta-barrel domain